MLCKCYQILECILARLRYIYVLLQSLCEHVSIFVSIFDNCRRNDRQSNLGNVDTYRQNSNATRN